MNNEEKEFLAIPNFKLDYVKVRVNRSTFKTLTPILKNACFQIASVKDNFYHNGVIQRSTTVFFETMTVGRYRQTKFVSGKYSTFPKRNKLRLSSLSVPRRYFYISFRGCAAHNLNQNKLLFQTLIIHSKGLARLDLKFSLSKELNIKQLLLLQKSWKKLGLSQCHPLLVEKSIVSDSPR